MTNNNLAAFFPQTYPIAAITRGNPTIIQTTVNHNYLSGNIIKIYLPTTSNNIKQLNGQFGLATILSPNTFSLPIDSTNYYPYVYNAAAPAQSVPIAEINQTLQNAVDNKGPNNP